MTMGRPQLLENLFIFYGVKQLYRIIEQSNKMVNRLESEQLDKTIFTGDPMKIITDKNQPIQEFLNQFNLTLNSPITTITKNRRYSVLFDVMKRIEPDTYLKFPFPLKPLKLDHFEYIADLRPKERKTILQRWRFGSGDPEDYNKDN